MVINMYKYFNRIFQGNKSEYQKVLSGYLNDGEKKVVVTANPEFFSYVKTDEVVSNMLLDETVDVIADGIGLVKAAKILGINLPERIPGVELTEFLFQYANEHSSKVCIFGSKQEVLDLLVEKMNRDYPNAQLICLENGYVSDKEEVFKNMIGKSPDICIVAMGMPIQEKLIYKSISLAEKGVFIGVGGSLDVISGYKKRAPMIFRKMHLEWLYRLMKEPQRISRFLKYNVVFLLEVRKLKK